MRLLILAACFLAPLFPATQALAADDLCVEAGPNNMSPTWWTGLSENVLEARWANATPFDGGRVIWDFVSKRLLFEVTVEGDNHLDPDDDLIALGLTDRNGAVQTYIEIRPMQTCAYEDCSIPTAVGGDVRYSRYLPTPTSGYWTKKSAISASSSSALEHVDVTVYDQGATFDYRVRFALRLPVDAATGQADPDQRMFLSAIHSTAGWTSATIHESPALCESDSVTSNTCEVLDPVDGIDLPHNLPIWNVSAMWPRVVTAPMNGCP